MPDIRNKTHQPNVYLLGQATGLCGSVPVAGSKLRVVTRSFSLWAYTASRTMAFDKAGKAVANESKYPFIIELPLAASGLDIALHGGIIAFHRSRPAAIWTHHLAKQTTLLSVVLFRSGDGACLCRTVWRRVLQNDWRLIWHQGYYWRHRD